VWIEIKERGTWWGNPWKALCEEGRGLSTDIEKWSAVKWEDGDIVLACQIVAHDAEEGCRDALPDTWQAVLDKIHAEHPRFVPTRSLCYPAIIPDARGIVHRFATIEFFTVHERNHISSSAADARR
jgi:hypothetical protein